MVVAVILAGGSGKRLGGELPKQLLEVAGRTILEHTIAAFEQNPDIDEIALVCHKDYIEDMRRIVQKAGFLKVRRLLLGGKERYDSSLAAIRSYDDDDCCLLLHDCARPLVSQRIISECVASLREYDAVDVAVPATDTIIEIDDQGRLARIPMRSHLRNVQTPQGFRRRTIRRAFELALADPAFQATDDCSVVFRYLPEVPIKVIEGETTNVKVTYPSDLEFVERILHSR